MKTLIVEDNADDRRILRYNLERHGCDVIEAVDGQEGLESARVHKPDLIISDALMPKMDGYRFLRSVKTDENLKSIPFIFYTAVYTGDKEADLAISLGADAFIIKPKESEELWDELQGILEKGKTETKPALTAALIEEEEEYLRKYSGIVATKLEEKVIELERAAAERKLAEESQRENESKLCTVTDTAADAIVMIDEEEKITYWNPAAEKMLGFSADEVMEKDITLIIPHRYRDAHRKAFNGFVETGRMSKKFRKTYAVEALKKDGAEIPVELSVSGVRIKGRCYSVGIIRDISERKKLEEQLLQSQKMEAVGQLAVGVAHDFNNILSAIIGYGHLLRMKMKADDPRRMNVEHLLESADRAAHLTHSLLAFSRKQVQNPRPVDLNEIIERVEKLLRRVMREDIELKTAFIKETVSVNADPGQIEQVLMNLATNARDAMPRGGSFTIEADTIELDDAFIRVHGYGEAGAFALVSVTDTGMGMDEETCKRIFEPFFTTKEVGKGTGLGLSMVYGIIRQHHGYINVYSEPDKGTTFRIYLPLIETEGEKRVLPAVAPEEKLPGTETVLVAEDDEMVRKLSRTMLEEFGYKVIEAEDGADAVDKFMKNRDVVQLVILDMIMPKKSGKDAYEEIKKIKPGIKTIFVSGYTADRLQRKGLLEEGMELVLKPISPGDFLKKVRTVLDA